MFISVIDLCEYHTQHINAKYVVHVIIAIYSKNMLLAEMILFIKNLKLFAFKQNSYNDQLTFINIAEYIETTMFVLNKYQF